MTQTEALYNLLRDAKPHRTDEILEKIYGGSHLGLARVGARVYDLNQKFRKENRAIEVVGWKDKENHALYWYHMRRKQVPTVVLPPAREVREKQMTLI